MKEELQQLCKQLRLARIMSVYEDIPFHSPTQFLLEGLRGKGRRKEEKIRRPIQKAKLTQLKTFCLHPSKFQTET
jgi:hypothetical protein